MIEPSSQVAAQTGRYASAISVAGLTKRYGDTDAVRGITFDVAAGETFGFLGPNGAGKTTTIGMLCTLVPPTAGHARVGGHDVWSASDDVRRNIGLVFQDTTVDGYLTGAENLRFHAELYGVPRAEVGDRIHQVLAMVGLWERRQQLVRTYSGGMKRRLEIARGLLHSPRVLFLDEPTIGLDPQTRVTIWGYLDELRSQEAITIFLTTHYLEEAERCDRIAIIDRGTIIALDTPAALKAAIHTDRIQIESNDVMTASATLRDRFGLRATVEGNRLTVEVADGERFLPTLLTELGVPIHTISLSRPSLDDVFLSYVGAAIRETDASTGSQPNSGEG